MSGLSLQRRMHTKFAQRTLVIPYFMCTIYISKTEVELPDVVRPFSPEIGAAFVTWFDDSAQSKPVKSILDFFGITYMSPTASAAALYFVSALLTFQKRYRGLAMCGLPAVSRSVCADRLWFDDSAQSCLRESPLPQSK